MARKIQCSQLHVNAGVTGDTFEGKNRLWPLLSTLGVQDSRVMKNNSCTKLEVSNASTDSHTVQKSSKVRGK